MKIFILDPLDRPFIYVCGQSSNSFEDIGGVLVFDVTIPTAPRLVSNFSTAYIHDMEIVQREDGSIVLYGCAIYDDVLYIIDVSDPLAHPNLNDQVIAVVQTISSPHNTAQTEDGAYLYITHEEYSYPVTIWNSTDLTNLQYVSSFSINPEQGTSPHNAMINGDYLWMSYYSEGVAVYDISEDPTSPVQLGQYDTSPAYDGGFHGVWGIYPYTPIENQAYASDIETGLWIVKLVGTTPSSSPSPIVSSNVTTATATPSFGSSVTPTPSVTVNGTNPQNNGTSSNTDATKSTADTGGNTFLWISISAGVILAIILIVVVAAIVGFFIYKKRVNKGNSVSDDFDGRIDEDDLF